MNHLKFKTRQKAAIGIVAMAAVMGLFGLSGAQAETKVKVTMVAGVKGDPFYITMMCGAKAEAEKQGATFDFQAPESFSPTDQVPVVNAVAAANPTIMLIAPTDDVAMYVPIKEVAANGTKVVLVDTSLKDTSSTVAQISTDDLAGGAEAARILSTLVEAGAPVLLLNFQPGVSTTEARGKGFLATAAEVGLKPLDEQFGGTDIQKSASIVSAALQQHPDLAGIFATTDYGAQGAVAALRSAQMLGKVKVVGFDASPVMVSQLQTGEIQAIVTQQAREIGKLGVQQGMNSINGGAASTAPIKVGTVTVTADTLDTPETKAVLQQMSCN